MSRRTSNPLRPNPRAGAWVPAIAHHRQPDGLTVRPRLAVLCRSGQDAGGVVWVGKESDAAWRAARKLAAWLNRHSTRVRK